MTTDYTVRDFVHDAGLIVARSKKVRETRLIAEVLLVVSPEMTDEALALAAVHSALRRGLDVPGLLSVRAA